MAAFEEALLGDGVRAPQDDVREGGEAGPSLREADDVRRDRLIGFVKHFLRSLHDSKSRESWSLRSLGSRVSWSLRIIGSRPLAVFWNASVLEPLSHGDSARIASRSLQARIRHPCEAQVIS